MSKIRFLSFSLLLALTFALIACGGSSGETADTTEGNAPQEVVNEAPEEVAEEEPAVAEEPVEESDKVQIRWFVGLGTGASPEQIPAQDELVAKFNAEHDNIELIVEYVLNEEAPGQLKTQIAGGNPPDIIGPVGQSGVNEFEGLFLDLQPHVDATNYDLSEFDPASVDVYKVDNGLYGIPFAVFPSMVFYNRDLFDEAGLDYPPHKFGEPYADGDAWTVEKLEELAMILTVDANGNDANSPDFDPENIVQFGYHTQWTDPRGHATALFGADYIFDEDGNATVSDNWRNGWNWYYSGIHEKHFMPNTAYQESDLMGAGNPFASGNLAMAQVHLWYTCCTGDVGNWDLAAVPAYDNDGNIVSKLHADTFRILDSTEHPEEAFEVLTWLLGEAAPDLLQVYGGMPARASLQDGFFATLDERFEQGVDWQVVIDGLAYPDIPNHESNMPNYAQAYDRIGAFQSLYESEPGLDINAEIDTLQADLQAIFSEAD